MPTITLKHKKNTVGDYQLNKGYSITIGRKSKNDVVIEDMAVSGLHAKIDSVEDRFVLVDLQSKNGTFVNEQLVSSHWLKHGDIINLGDHALAFHDFGDGPKAGNISEELEGTMFIDTSQYRSMMQKSNPTKSINVVRFWDKNQHGSVKKGDSNPSNAAVSSTNYRIGQSGALTFLEGGNGKVDLTRHITSIGKHRTCDIIVKGLFVGQTAATISKKPDGFYLCHVNGISKPKINEKKVTQPTRLNHLDVIEISSTKLQFLDGDSQEQEKTQEFSK